MSGVSVPTVYRILAEQNSEASWSNVQAIAQALGFDVAFQPKMSAQDMRHKQAVQQANWITKMAQATSALDAVRAVDQLLSPRLGLRDQTVHELLAGPNRRLWARR